VKNQPIFVPAENTANLKLYYIHLRQRILPFWNSFCATPENEIGNELVDLVKEVKQRAKQLVMGDQAPAKVSW